MRLRTLKKCLKCWTLKTILMCVFLSYVFTTLRKTFLNFKVRLFWNGWRYHFHTYFQKCTCSWAQVMIWQKIARRTAPRFRVLAPTMAYARDARRYYLSCIKDQNRGASGGVACSPRRTLIQASSKTCETPLPLSSCKDMTPYDSVWRKIDI